MGRPTNKAQVKKQLREALNIKDLKEYIKNFPDTMPIGITGHFGELELCSKYDLQTTKGYLTANGFWTAKAVLEDVKVFTIHFPDIGPEPD